MARARHEAPMAEEPEKHPFDLSDIDTEPAEAPKPAKKRAKGSPPIPKEALSPRKRAKPVINRIKPFVPSEDAKLASELYLKRDQAKQAAEAEDLTHEAVEIEDDGDYAEYSVTADKPTDAEIKASLKANQMPVSDDMVDAYSAAVDAEKMGEDMRAEEAWKKAHPVLTDKEGLKRLGEKAQIEELQSKAYEAKLKRLAKEKASNEPATEGYTADEEKWFKAGEEEEARQMEEARATIERGGKGELMVENAGDVEANIHEASKLFKAGDLSPRDFSVEDYAYLLKERVRIDKELEHAGWWKARSLRKELGQILKGGFNGAPNGLDDYEKQIMDAKLGNVTARKDAEEKAARASGAPAKKLSFWERLKLGKGR